MIGGRSQPILHGLGDSRRLLELERILASSQRTSTQPVAAGTDINDVLLGRVLIDRIRETTTLLSGPDGDGIDAADLVAMRLLLSDYVTAVAYVRAATAAIEGRLARSAAVLKEDGRRIKGALEEAKRRQERANLKNAEAVKN